MTNEERLQPILSQNPSIAKILRRTGDLGMPNWYLGAGGIAQTVWNVLLKRNPEEGIQDYDLVYYDADDISYEAEDAFIKKGLKAFADIPVEVQIRNQARVHLWYKKHFGFSIKQYQSVEDAIRSWPTTANSIGITVLNGKLHVYAPFGLDDLFGMIVRANKTLVTREMFENKVARWARVWPELKIMPWERPNRR